MTASREIEKGWKITSSYKIGEILSIQRVCPLLKGFGVYAFIHVGKAIRARWFRTRSVLGTDNRGGSDAGGGMDAAAVVLLLVAVLVTIEASPK